jgi:hypothetical protein
MLRSIGVSGALLSAFLFLGGCGGGSSSSTPPATITVAITGNPQSIAASATATLTATVTNDSSAAGVNWTCAPANSCGSFNPTHTASGAATTYTAPAAAGSVTITATSAASSTAVANATITVTGPTVSVAITGAPTSLVLNGTAQLTGTVTNDSTNAGVDWTCAPSGTCGSFNPAHTASGSATTFTAPGAAGSVTITAASTASPSSTSTATINVTAVPGGQFAAGKYAYFGKGTDSGGFTYGMAGSITLDGNGNVTAGEQDYNNGHGVLSAAGGDTISGGTYTVGATGGPGTLMLMTNNANLGANGTEHFSVTLVNSKHAVFTQTDASGTATGSIDLQTLSATPSLSDIAGNYSFAVSGAADGSEAEVFGGQIQVTGAGTVHVTVDVNADGTLSTGGSNTGTYTAPDANGRATVTFGGDLYAAYRVGPEVLRLLVLDSNRGDVGSALGQGSGTFSTNSVNGGFVFNLGSASSGAGSFAAAGQFTSNGGGGLTAGFADSDLAGTVNSSSFTGTYTVGTAVAGTGYGSATITSASTLLNGNYGVYAVDPALNILDPNNTTSGGGGALLIGLSSQSKGVGVVLPQATPSAQSFSGTYAANYRSFTPAGVEQDADGQINVATGDVITGLVDVNQTGFANPSLGIALSGTAIADTNNPGRFSLPLTISLGNNPPTLTFAIYQASTGDLLWVETDTTQYATGSIQQQQQ